MRDTAPPLSTDLEAQPVGASAPGALFVTLTHGRACAGDEDAVVALHEEWVRRCASKSGLLSSEILVDPVDPQVFVAISHFANQAAAERSLDDPEHSAWRRRLATLSEAQLVQRDMLSLWRAGSPPPSSPTLAARPGGT